MLGTLSRRAAISQSVSEVLDGCGFLGSCKPKIYFLFIINFFYKEIA